MLTFIRFRDNKFAIYKNKRTRQESADSIKISNIYEVSIFFILWFRDIGIITSFENGFKYHVDNVNLIEGQKSIVRNKALNIRGLINIL